MDAAGCGMQRTGHCCCEPYGAVAASTVHTAIGTRVELLACSSCCCRFRSSSRRGPRQVPNPAACVTFALPLVFLPSFFPPRYEREAKDKNRESWYMAYIMDTNEEERAKVGPGARTSVMRDRWWVVGGHDTDCYPYAVRMQLTIAVPCCC